MPYETRTYAVTMTLCVGIAGDEAGPIPTDHRELAEILAENFVEHLNGLAEGGNWSEVADNINSVLMVVENDRIVDQPQIVYPFSIPKENGDEGGEVNGFIEIGPIGIEVFLDGYGTACTNPGMGSVVYVDHWLGHPQVVIHGDILQEDPTQIINRGTASESRRDQVDAAEPLHTTRASANLLERRRDVTYLFREADPE